MQLRIASLDPAFAPGRVVALPGEGLWRVESWEWRGGGVELNLVRSAPDGTAPVVADGGTPWRPVDRLPAATVLHAFELPWDGAGAADAARLHVAAGASEGRWSGAALYVERNGALVPIGTANPPRAVTGKLERSLGSSPALMFEGGASIHLRCDDRDAALTSADGAALAAGANRLLVGDEIIQFLHAGPMGGGSWQLSGLLRGRGGTEPEAGIGHAAGARAILLDERLLVYDATIIDPASERLAAIGAGDTEPVFAAVTVSGRSRRPLAPVHPVTARLADGTMRFEWTRRARGSWVWSDGVEVPLVEEGEAYEIGAGPIAAPIATWNVNAPRLMLASGAFAAIASGTPLWVRQIGTYAPSGALLLHLID